MSIQIDQLQEHLDTDLVCRNAGDMPSLVAALCRAYVLHDSGESGGGDLLVFSQGMLTGCF